MNIENTCDCFEQLWHELERTRQQLKREGRIFCIRRVLQQWFPNGMQTKRPYLARNYLSFDEMCYLICYKACVMGYTTLPDPADDPAPCRDFLRALVAVYLGIGLKRVLATLMEKAKPP